ncbi:GPI-anchored protein LLG1-like [Silene latifolia]|uniref:GPI-anchored protein LLG1-like n=1 Tax=Silene latifolia TaxID=37657 RepID=UPI003D785B6C
MSMELRLCTKIKPIMSTLTLFIIFCLFSSTFASDSFISSSVLGTDQLDQPRLSTSRALLQAQKPCPINFENQNYTIITSKCKGPRYPAAECCPSFTDFACQFSDELNDLTNQCAQTMFSYINLNGGYPPGLFANECKGSKRGLECKATPSGAASIYGITRHGSLLSFLSAAVFLLVVGRII